MSELPWPITKQPITSIRSFCTSNSSADFYCIRSKIFHKKWPKYDFPFFDAVDLRSHELALKVSAVQDGIDAIKIHCNLSYTKLQPAVYKLLPYSHPHLCIWICHVIYILHTLCLSISLTYCTTQGYWSLHEWNAVGGKVYLEQPGESGLRVDCKNKRSACSVSGLRDQSQKVAKWDINLEWGSCALEWMKKEYKHQKLKEQ